jgi:SPP1 gp7 family putative phage head morphogenesis protein
MLYLNIPPKENRPFKIAAKDRSPFQRGQNIQEDFARALRGVAREVAKLIKGYDPKDVVMATKLRNALRNYSEIIGPWALNLSGGIIQRIDRQDKFAWEQHTKQMALSLKKEILNAPMGEVYKDLMRRQVELIQSIPLEAAERVHGLVTENLWQSERANEIAKKILQTESITVNRATLIARTEVARAASKLTESRATSVGSEGYIWRTSKDLLVRKSHKEMDGKYVKWTEPPVLDKMTGHAGCFPNCRCYPEPVIPEEKFI